jgi:hypothetical protein
MILENFNSHYLVSSLIPTLDHLAECASAQELKDLVAVRHRIEYLMQDKLIVTLVSSIIRVGYSSGRRCSGVVVVFFYKSYFSMGQNLFNSFIQI